MRPGMSAALAILHQISVEFNIAIPSLRDPVRLADYVVARREFYARCVAAKISVQTITSAIERDHSTISYHLNQPFREKKLKLMRVISVKTHCIRGHEFTAQNTDRVWHKGKGTTYRRCRKCHCNQVKRAYRKATKMRSRERYRIQCEVVT
jgi:hypothetical protein